jgi:hypothetical protein
MSDLELLRLIQERRAELQRAELAALGPIDDARRIQALNLLIAAAGRGDPDAAARLERCANLLGVEFRAAVIEHAARQEPEEPEGEPEEGEPVPPSNAAHVQPEEPATQENISHLAPVEQPPQRELPLPWYEGAQPSGLRRSNEIKRRFLAQKSDRSLDAGSSWMKR